MQKNNAIKATIIIMIATILSRFVGFFREITIGNVLGTSNIADAYIVALSVPGIIFMNIASAIGTTYIPMYVRQKEKYGIEKSLKFTNNLINMVLLVSILLSIISIIFAKPILSLVAYGFDDETLNIAASISRIIFINIIFMGVNVILSGYLQSNNRFVMSVLIGIPNSAVIICSLFLYEKFGIIGVSYATVLGMFLQFLILLTNSFLIDYRFKPILNFKDEEIKNILLLAMPVFIGSSISQLNSMIDKMLASGLESGSIASLDYAYKLNNFVFGITSIAIATVIYPMLSKLSAQDDNVAYKNLINKSINVVTILLLPISVAACILSEPIVIMLFERGAFDSRSTYLTASALFYYSFGMVFYGYRDILSRAFYSIQDTKTPTINGVASLLMNILFNIMLVRLMLHKGLALATSITALISTLILALSLRNKIGSIGGKKILRTVCKSGISATVMGILVFIIYQYLKSSFLTGSFIVQLSIFSLLVGIGGIVYLTLLIIFRTEELVWVLRSILKGKATDR